jgi:hypothetical protein
MMNLLKKLKAKLLNLWILLKIIYNISIYCYCNNYYKLIIEIVLNYILNNKKFKLDKKLKI